MTLRLAGEKVKAGWFLIKGRARKFLSRPAISADTADGRPALIGSAFVFHRGDTCRRLNVANRPCAIVYSNAAGRGILPRRSHDWQRAILAGCTHRIRVWSPI
jgi:hypothetical protein